MPKNAIHVPSKSCLHCKHFTKMTIDYGYCDLMMMLSPSKLPVELRRKRVSFSTVSGDEKGANIWVGVAFCCKYFERKNSVGPEYFSEDEDEDE